MSDLIDRLKTAWTLLSNDGDEYGLCDTLREASAALEAAREDALRYRWIRGQDNEDFRFSVVKNPHFDVYDSAEELDTAIDQARGKGVVSCRCHTERDKELCLNKRECVAIFPHGGKGIVPEQGEGDRG